MLKIIKLSEETKKILEARHRKERDGRIKDRIKAVLLKDEGWTYKQIAQALRIHELTVSEHLDDWEKEEKLKPNNGGSESKLNKKESRLLRSHLETKTYMKVSDICKYVKDKFAINYTVSGMTYWLHRNKFTYKKPKLVPYKADYAEQKKFIERYTELVGKEEPILFIDSVHPTMATKPSYGWIPKGQDRLIGQTASRTRVNITGSIELSTLKMLHTFTQYVNGESTSNFFKIIRKHYRKASKINIILDRSGYHRSKLVREEALKHNIVLHYLPPYSPNLNPIERLWKIMNEQVRNNKFFDSPQKFKKALEHFFEKKFSTMKQELRTRINDNFQLINPVTSF